MPHYYEVDGDEIVDVDSGERLNSRLAASAASGTALRITTYGDVVNVDGPDGVARVASVTPADWFAGHLS